MIEYRGFRKQFGAIVAVDRLDLAIAAGEVVALLGPNGSGKTTALKAAAGLLRPSAGEVRVGGRPAAEPAARVPLSYLPQKVAFPEAQTGREAVEFYRALRGVDPRRSAEVLRFASLEAAADRVVATYSGGMAQRLGLAIAMLPDAPLLLLDEPTAALDADGLAAFRAILEAHRREGRTVFFTSHQLGDVEGLVDRFAILVDGRLVAVLGRGELAARLAERGRLRLRVAATPAGHRPRLLDALRPLAPQAAWAGDELVVPGAAAARPAVLDAVRAAGAEITAVATEEGRLDVLYRELVGAVSSSALPTSVPEVRA